MIRKSCISALTKLANSAVELCAAWEINMPSSDNGYSEATNDLLCTDYPFDEDFNEVVTKILAWKWSVIEKAEGR